MSDKSVRISHPAEVFIKNISTKGQFELTKGTLFQFMEESPTSSIVVITFQFSELSSFNCIQFDSMEKENEFKKYEIENKGIVFVGDAVIKGINIAKKIANA